MNWKEIKELLDLVVEKGISEFELERSGVRIRVRRDFFHVAPVNPGVANSPLPPPVMIPTPAAPPQVAAPPEAAPGEPLPEPPGNLHVIKSPIVGTFYAAPAPDAPPFVQPGDHVEAGKVLCIIEAMKLMNEIESDVAGEIVKCHVANAQPVEYGELLFSIRPKRKK
jgi:acetyl-CoA carboxylase biotin carboxyl carrier protein